MSVLRLQKVRGQSRHFWAKLAALKERRSRLLKEGRTRAFL